MDRFGGGLKTRRNGSRAAALSRFFVDISEPVG
jgi:hypothetical protein